MLSLTFSITLWTSREDWSLGLARAGRTAYLDLGPVELSVEWRTSTSRGW